jgi:hypothetical protein
LKIFPVRLIVYSDGVIKEAGTDTDDRRDGLNHGNFFIESGTRRGLSRIMAYDLPRGRWNQLAGVLSFNKPLTCCELAQDWLDGTNRNHSLRNFPNLFQFCWNIAFGNFGKCWNTWRLADNFQAGRHAIRAFTGIRSNYGALNTEDIIARIDLSWTR